MSKACSYIASVLQLVLRLGHRGVHGREDLPSTWEDVGGGDLEAALQLRGRPQLGRIGVLDVLIILGPVERATRGNICAKNKTCWCNKTKSYCKT